MFTMHALFEKLKTVHKVENMTKVVFRDESRQEQSLVLITNPFLFYNTLCAAGI